jgi:hypothetical protein
VVKKTTLTDVIFALKDTLIHQITHTVCLLAQNAIVLVLLVDHLQLIVLVDVLEVTKILMVNVALTINRLL